MPVARKLGPVLFILATSVAMAAFVIVIGSAVTRPAATAAEGSSAPAESAAPSPTGGVAGATASPVPSASASPTATPTTAATASMTPAPTPRPSGQPLDLDAIARALATRSYRFTAEVAGLPSLDAASPVALGSVADPEHFDLRFPGGSFISRYERDGDVRTAWIGGTRTSIRAGLRGDRTPEDLLPGGIFAWSIAPWLAALPDAPTDGEYVADPLELAALVAATGVRGDDWRLRVRVDADGRLIGASFTGTGRAGPFRLVLAIAYAGGGGG